MYEDFEIGDHVRVVNLLADKRMPVGIVERINGGYIYVHTPVAGETEDDPCVYEAYSNELVHVTEQEYFKLLLQGANIEPGPGKIKL